jgi:hypothetical protein
MRPDARRLLGAIVLVALAASCGTRPTRVPPDAAGTTDGGPSDASRTGDAASSDGADDAVRDVHGSDARPADHVAPDDATSGAGAGAGAGGSGGAAGGGTGAAGGAQGPGGGGAAGAPPPGLLTPLFRAAQIVGPYGAFTLPRPVDLDRDGWLDLVWDAHLSAAFGFAVNDRAGGFRDAVQVQSLSSNALAGVGDFDGDGLIDVAMSTWSPLAVYVSLARADGTFKPATQIYVSYEASSSVLVTGDLNGDSKTDLVVARRPHNTSAAVIIDVILGVGPGVVATSTSFDTADSRWKPHHLRVS